MKQPTQKLSISRDEICAIYAQGEDAVIALVESLVARTNALEGVKIARIVVNPLQVMVSGNERRVFGQRVVVKAVGKQTIPAAPWHGAKQLIKSSPIPW